MRHPISFVLEGHFLSAVELDKICLGIHSVHEDLKPFVFIMLWTDRGRIHKSVLATVAFINSNNVFRWIIDFGHVIVTWYCWNQQVNIEIKKWKMQIYECQIFCLEFFKFKIKIPKNDCWTTFLLILP
jgi:hypothetical protein